MKTLVIYDLEGTVIKTIYGGYKVPVGIPFLEVDVPEGKMIKSVNVEGEEHFAVFEKLPSPTINQLIEKISNQEAMTEELEAAIYNLAEMLDQVLRGGE